MSGIMAMMASNVQQANAFTYIPLPSLQGDLMLQSGSEDLNEGSGTEDLNT
jgi:hypothetical protein